MERSDTASIMFDFKEKAISKVAFARTKEETDRLKKQENMEIYFPLKDMNFGDEVSMYVLLG